MKSEVFSETETASKTEIVIAETEIVTDSETEIASKTEIDSEGMKSEVFSETETASKTEIDSKDVTDSTAYPPYSVVPSGYPPYIHCVVIQNLYN